MKMMETFNVRYVDNWNGLDGYAVVRASAKVASFSSAKDRDIWVAERTEALGRSFKELDRWTIRDESPEEKAARLEGEKLCSMRRLADQHRRERWWNSRRFH